MSESSKRTEHEILAKEIVVEERVFRPVPHTPDELEFNRVVDAKSRARKMFYCKCGAGKWRKDETAIEHLKEHDAYDY